MLVTQYQKVILQIQNSKGDFKFKKIKHNLFRSGMAQSS